MPFSALFAWRYKNRSKIESPGNKNENKTLKAKPKNRGIIKEIRLIFNQPPLLQKTENALNKKRPPAISNGTCPVNNSM